MRGTEDYRSPRSLADCLRPLQDQILAHAKAGLPADKAFFDSLSGDDMIAMTQSPPSLSEKME